MNTLCGRELMKVDISQHSSFVNLGVVGNQRALRRDIEKLLLWDLGGNVGDAVMVVVLFDVGADTDFGLLQGFWTKGRAEVGR